MDRRSFIKLTAVTGGATAIAACSTSSPENQLIRFVPDEDLTPGIAEFKNSMCPICRAGCGTTVRVMQGDADVVRNGQLGVMTMSLAKKVDGNASHPVSQGKLCPRGQASIQITYHPDRIVQPLTRRGARGSGDYQPVSWDAAIAELVAKLDASGGSLAALTRPGSSSRNDPRSCPRPSASCSPTSNCIPDRITSRTSKPSSPKPVPPRERSLAESWCVSR